MDYNFITTRLATGGGLVSSDTPILLADGITSVVDCRSDFNDAEMLSRRFNYLWNPTEDDGHPKPVSWFQKTINFVLPLLVAPKNKILLHCAQGINRGPSALFAVLLCLGFTFKEAEAIIWFKRPKTLIGIRYKHDAERAVSALGYIA